MNASVNTATDEIDFEFLYAMLEAEFHLSPDWIDEHMDLQRFEGHLRYRSFNPPIGALFKAFMGSLDESGQGAELRYTGKSSKELASNDLQAFAAVFGEFGGKISTKTGGEKDGNRINNE